MDFKGKVVLVTGASRGIGAAIARAFAARGAAVAINYRSRHEAAQEVVEACRIAGGTGGGDAIALPANVMDPEQAKGLVESTVKEFGRLDVLVNNALPAYSFNPEQRRSFDQMSWGDYQQQMQANVGAAFFVTHAALDHLRMRADGTIVNILSDLIEDPALAYHDYATAKSALLGFSRQLATDLGPQGVRVNCVAPGLVYPTEGSADTRASFRERIMAATPLRRLARPEDIAGPVVFLASKQSGFMTGQVLYVNGGRVMR